MPLYLKAGTSSLLRVGTSLASESACCCGGACNAVCNVCPCDTLLSTLSASIYFPTDQTCSHIPCPRFPFPNEAVQVTSTFIAAGTYTTTLKLITAGCDTYDPEVDPVPLCYYCGWVYVGTLQKGNIFNDNCVYVHHFVKIELRCASNLIQPYLCTAHTECDWNVAQITNTSATPPSGCDCPAEYGCYDPGPSFGKCGAAAAYGKTADCNGTYSSPPDCTVCTDNCTTNKWVGVYNSGWQNNPTNAPIVTVT
jgi:hypothetical protein